MKKMVSGKKGQTLVEYALLLSLIVILCGAVLGTSSDGPLNQLYNKIKTVFTNAAARL